MRFFKAYKFLLWCSAIQTSTLFQEIEAKASKFTPPERFTFSVLPGRHTHYNVTWMNKTVAYQVNSTTYADVAHMFTLNISSSAGHLVSVNVNTDRQMCSTKQTYKSTDQVQFAIYPRGTKADFWRIKKGPKIPENYWWHRRYSSLSGPIRTENGTYLAHFHAQGKVRFTQYTISSTGEIPDDVLLQLYTTAITRSNSCSL